MATTHSWKILVLFLLIASCKSSKKTTGDNSQTSLDWQGVYSGIVPCADCEGILTTINLKADNTYDMQTKYIGKSDEVFTSTGSFSWSQDRSGITLKSVKEGTGPVHYKVGENKLIQLDLQGNAITGNNAANYNLIKGDAGIENKYWKLIEINGKPVATANWKREPHILFHPGNNNVSGSGGCNNFSGTYKLESNNRISFTPMAATKMFCEGTAETEDLMFKAIGSADSYYVSKDSMQLIKARMAPLAKFVAVYMK